MRWKSVVVAVLLAGALAVPPGYAVAQAAGGETRVVHFDKEKLFDYAACGVSIAFAVGTQGWFVVGIACGRALTHWIN